MKKFIKIIAAALVCIMILSCMSVFAEPADDTPALPFTLAAPTKTATVWLEGRDSPTTMSYTYTIDNSIAEFFKKRDKAALDETIDEFMSQYDFKDIEVIVQIDWALDDVNDEISGWHCNEYWLQRGDVNIKYDEDWNIRTSEWDMPDWGLGNATETAQTVWVTRSVPNDERWNGNPDTKTPGVKDQLRPEQYEYRIDEEDDGTLYIDYTEHTMYFRSRLVALTWDEDDKLDAFYSEWSDISGYGKDIAAVEPVQPGEIDPPVISNLRLTDMEFEDNPVVAYTLTVPDKLQDQLSRVDVKGGVLWIEAWARIIGTTEWKNITGDWVVTPGEMRAYLNYLTENGEMIPEGVGIEMRCRYYCSQWNDDIGEFWSDWSNVITFGIVGDLNDDGNVDNKDVVLLFRYVSGANNKYDYLYDFNQDGEVNNKDVTALFRYVSSQVMIVTG